jgi:hypothetical protein
LKLQYDELLSNFAHNFNMRRYIKAAGAGKGKQGEVKKTK